MLVYFSATPADWLDNLLKEKLNGAKIGDALEDVRWSYVAHCLKLLSDLKSSLLEVSQIGHDDKTKPPLDTLSVSQQQNVSSMIQLVIALGIVPSLIPGVGIPIEKRSKFYEIVMRSHDSKSVEEVRVFLVGYKKMAINWQNCKIT